MVTVCEGVVHNFINRGALLKLVIPNDVLEVFIGRFGGIHCHYVVMSSGHRWKPCRYVKVPIMFVLRLFKLGGDVSGTTMCVTQFRRQLFLA